MIQERIARTEHGIRMILENRRAAQKRGDAAEVLATRRRMRIAVAHLRQLDAIAAREAQKIAAE